MSTTLQTRPTAAETTAATGAVSSFRRALSARRARHGAMAARIASLPATRGVAVVSPAR